jgi:hypothetical protein
VTRRSAIKLAITVASVAALAFAARDLDVASVAEAVRRVDPVFGLLAAFAMLGAKLGAKVVRSQILLAASCRRLGIAPPAWATTARLLAASHAAGQLAWGPLGFTVRTVALCDGGMPLGAVARVHVAERIAEAAGIAALALAAFVFAPAAIWDAWLGRVLLAALAAAALTGIAVGLSPRLRGFVVRNADTGGALVRSSAWALASSIADVTVLLLAARGMHVAVDLPAALLAFLAVNGACAVPVTPAPQALACALAYRAAHVVPLALVGLPALLATWARRAKPAAAAGSAPEARAARAA